MSQSAMATLLGYSTGYIKNIEHGRQRITDKFRGRFLLASSYPTLGSFVTREGYLALTGYRDCDCGCGAKFLPRVWNQKRIPGHRRR